ncbi:MAG TPA: histidinol-phosphatase HisJ [Bacillus bacterium]|nr:histidinol-phosphatase HisJ [Bacillus sp. (in: firmicutes)]
MKIDGHIHSPYCPHGSTDSFEQYINQAISLGYGEISFTEHAPLPATFADPTPDKDSGMNPDFLELYISDLQKLKEKYKDKIKINIGLEVDYIIHFEEETTKFLTKFGQFLDDSILSVHFLYKEGNYYCLDFSVEEFARIISLFGTTDEVYRSYYEIVKQSIMADLGPFKPKRIGHMTLANKFQKKYPANTAFHDEIIDILDLIKENNMSLDYNGAGVSKPFCLEPYPAEWIVKEADKRKIPLIYGSDAHVSRDLNQGYKQLVPTIKLSSPTSLLG